MVTIDELIKTLRGGFAKSAGPPPIPARPPVINRHSITIDPDRPSDARSGSGSDLILERDQNGDIRVKPDIMNPQ